MNRQDTLPNFRQDKMQIDDCIVVHMCGAIYSLSDMIIFEVLKEVAGECYMRMIVQWEEIMEDVYVFRWCEIPKEIMQIYNYVNITSTLEKGVLYGTHINRKESRKYALIKFKENPIGQTQNLSKINNPDYTKETFESIAYSMQKVKNIA